MSRKLLGIVIIAMFASLITIGCADDSAGDALVIDDPGAPQYKGSALKKAANCDELEDYLKDTARNELARFFISMENQKNGYYYWYYDDVAAEFDSDGNSPPMATDDLSAGGGDRGAEAPDYTGTNNQEEGVDEADFVKTDGNFIYLISGRYLSIFKSWPADELSKLSEVELPGYPMELFVSGDRAVVFSMVWDQVEPNNEFTSRVGGFLKATVFDITNRSNPAIERDLYIEGNYSSSRMVGSKVYLVTNTYLNLFDPWNLVYETIQKNPRYDSQDFYNNYYENITSFGFRSAVFATLNGYTLDDLLPSYYDVLYTADGKKVEEFEIAPCTEFYIPVTPNGRGTVSVLHLDLDDPLEEINSVGILSNNGQVYASQDNLYIAATNYNYWYGYEWEDEDWSQRTYIHKFSLGTEPSYKASGEVDGYMLNQFSMSEYDGFLRTATTVERWGKNWSDFSQSNSIYVLEEDGASLDIVGEIPGIAVDERIYSARFLGDRGFVVTFRQVDPLFAIDLSDPRDPKITGELKIPGFSNYLHPVGDDYLIGLGRAADDNGSVQGMKISLFDVSDMTNPTEAHNITIGTDWGTSSEATYNHKAFLYFEKMNLLVIPVTYWGDWIPCYDYNYPDKETDPTGVAAPQYCGPSNFFNGVYIYKVSTDTGFTLLGKVDHSDLYNPVEDSGAYWWYGWNGDYQVRRSSFIGTDAAGYNLFTISGSGIKATNGDTFEDFVASASAPFAWDYYYYGPIGGFPLEGRNVVGIAVDDVAVDATDVAVDSSGGADSAPGN